MVEYNMKWMNQGPLEVLGVLHKIPRHAEKLFLKYDPDKIVKAKYHLNMFLPTSTDTQGML